MSDKESTTENNDSDDLTSLMDSVSDDLYDVGSGDSTMDDELESIASKLADDIDDLDLDLGDDNLQPDSEAINLLDDDDISLPDGDGLSYEEPGIDIDFADTLDAAKADQQPKPPVIEESGDDDSFLNDDDPMLLLDEELVMDKESNEGGILTIAALALAVLGLAMAGFATWQNISTGSQISELTTRLDNPPKMKPDPRIAQLESMLSQTNGKLSQVETQLHSDAASLKDLDDRLKLILEETRKADDSQATKLDGIGKQIKELAEKITSTESRIGQNRSQLEKKQEAIRTEFNDRLRILATTPPPRRVTASTNPAAVQSVQTLKPTPVKKPVTATVLKPEPAAKPPPEKSVAKKPKPQSGGNWVANLASFRSERDAKRILRKLQRHGVFPKKRRVFVKGKKWYRLYVDGFANMRAAQRYISTVKGKPGLSKAWAGRAD